MAVSLVAAALLVGAGWAHPFGAADGRRYAAGKGVAPRWTAQSLDLPGVGWLVALGGRRLAAVDGGGDVLILEVGTGGLAVVARQPGVAAPEGAVVAARLGADGSAPVFVTPDGRLAVWTTAGVRIDRFPHLLSPLGHPTAVDLDGDGVDELLALDRGGALLLLEGLRDGARLAARLSVDAVPDARVTVSGNLAVVLTAPTERYRHAILGDPIEAGGVTVVDVAPGQLTERGRLLLPATAVFEDQRMALADVDGDGRPDGVATVSHLDRGSAPVVVRLGARGPAVLAEGPPVGQPHRWQHTLGAADLDGDGAVEVVSLRTPHLGGVLQAWRRRGGRLELVATHPGVSSHAPGSRNLDAAALADLDGDGRPEVIVPTQARTALVGVELRGGRWGERWRLELRSPVGSNIVVADVDGDGRLDLAAADADAVHVLSSGETR